MSVLPVSSDRGLAPSEFSLAWRIVLLGVAGVLTSMSSALLYGFGSLVVPLQEAFGWTRGELQSSITFLFAGVAIGSQLLGWLYARFGLRRVAIVSLLVQVLGYLALTRLNGSVYWLYFAFFVMPLLGAGTIAITWTQLISVWFERNRGVALAIILSGSGLAAMLMPPLLAWAVRTGGWQAAFMLLAAMPLLLTLPLAIVYLRFPARRVTKDNATAPESTLDGVPFNVAIRTWVFWACNLALILSV
jgi:MFS family permease